MQYSNKGGKNEIIVLQGNVLYYTVINRPLEKTGFFILLFQIYLSISLNLYTFYSSRLALLQYDIL